MSQQDATVLVVSDLHCGSTVAMWPEGQTIQDGGICEPNAAQLWLSQQWQTMLSEVAKLKRKPTLILLGDLVQGGFAKDSQLVSGLPSVQARGAIALLQPLRKLCSRAFCIKGTEWHEGALSDAVEGVAESLGCEPNPATGQRTWPALYLNVGGAVTHFAHHVGVSSVPAYEATMPLRELLTMLVEMHRYWPEGGPNLRMIVRAHRHRGIYVEAPPDLRAMVVPGWQLSTSFAHKKMPGLLPQVGYGLIESKSGRLSAHLRTFALPMPSIQEVK